MKFTTDEEIGKRGAITRAFVPVLAILYILGFTNLFLRSSFGVMAPDLAREMRLSPELLSTIASAFFFAYAAMQIPTGMLLDRFGPRWVLAGPPTPTRSCRAVCS